MTNEEFVKKWTENRKEILANNEEYQRIVQSYKSSGWIDYIIFIAGFVICENYTKTIINSVVLQYLLALIGMILIWLGYRLIKGLFDSKQTLEELEEKIKQQYKDSVGN